MSPPSSETMRVNIESSRLLKPSYADLSSSTLQTIPLTVFDKIAPNVHVALLYAFRPPTPPFSHLVRSLSKVLSEYREWAGRFAEDAAGNPVILLNDAGMRLVEASVDSPLTSLLPLEPSPELRRLHPTIDGVVEELAQVQLTRFACGSLTIGFTVHHRVADGPSTSSFLVAWGLNCRGLPFQIPARDRAALIAPRNPPEIAFDHRGMEYNSKNSYLNNLTDEVTMQKAHFTPDLLTELKAKATGGCGRLYTTFEALMAHMWMVMTRARELDEQETTNLIISVNGRGRMSPQVPGEYFGNLVLWAKPSANVGELINKPLQHAAELIHQSIEMIDKNYFEFFIDFATSGAVEEEGLVPLGEGQTVTTMCPDIDVVSWVRLPFNDLNFGGETPFLFMPAYDPVEGLLFLAPSLAGDKSIDVYVTLFEKNVALFKAWTRNGTASKI